MALQSCIFMHVLTQFLTTFINSNIQHSIMSMLNTPVRQYILLLTRGIKCWPPTIHYFQQPRDINQDSCTTGYKASGNSTPPQRSNRTARRSRRADNDGLLLAASRSLCPCLVVVSYTSLAVQVMSNNIC